MSFIRNAWYCAGWSADIAQEPIGRRILNEPLVLYRIEEGQVAALSDICPHRFAPLHRGKVVENTIECPYHGLRFGADGHCSLNPHGSGRIPAALRVKSYPIIESQGAAWIWMGEKAADPALIPDIELFDQPGVSPAIRGHEQMPIEWRMMVDNLLDLSHATYLHGDTLSPAKTNRRTEFSHTETSVKSSYFMHDIRTPEVHRALFEHDRGDYYSHMELILPSNLRNRLTMTPVGADRDEGFDNRTCHLLTPETEGSIHYFWAATRNRAIDNERINAAVSAIIHNAIYNEDQPMIVACQEYMGGRDFFDLKPVYLETDASATRARRMLEVLIAREESERRQAAAAAA